MAEGSQGRVAEGGEVMGTGQMVEGMAGILGSLGSTLNERGSSEGSEKMSFSQRSKFICTLFFF